MRQEQQAGGGRQRNARSNGPSDNGMGSEETVRYVNKELNPDHEVHDSD
jgi:hypothetical protein